MVALLHVAGLAGRGRCFLGQRAGLLEQRAHTVLGGGIHFPLRMIEPHVAGLAGLRLLGLLLRERMPRMAGVAGRYAKPGACLFQVLDFLGGLEPDLMASAAAFHALG